MATFPGAIISLTNPSASTSMLTVSHSNQHILANDEIEAIETALGVNLGNLLLAAALDTDGTLAADSDAKIASQKAVRTYIDNVVISGGGLPIGYLDTDGTFAANSDVKVPSQKAAKTYVDTAVTNYASQVQAEAGTNATTLMNPLRVSQAIAALAPSSLSVSAVSFTRDIATTGTQAVTGVGGTPVAIIFIAASGGFAEQFSIGWYVSTNDGIGTNGTAGIFASVGQLVRYSVDGSNHANAIMSSLDADGFTVTWAKTGAPTGTVSVEALCFYS